MALTLAARDVDLSKRVSALVTPPADDAGPALALPRQLIAVGGQRALQVAVARVAPVGFRFLIVVGLHQQTET